MGARENECQISQNYILHMKFSEFHLYFHYSCKIWHSFSRTLMGNFLWYYYRIFLFLICCQVFFIIILIDVLQQLQKKNRMKEEWRKNKIKVNTDTMLLQMTNYIFWALEKCKKNAVFFKLFWYKVFVHWKLKFLNFLVDSVLKFSPGFTRFTP